MINQQTKSVSHYRDLLQNIEEGWASDTGESLWKWAFGKSAKEIAEKLGDRVVTTANGQKTVWKRVDNGGDNVVYEVIHSDGNTAIGTPIKPEDLSKLKPKPFDIRTDTLPAPKQPKVRRAKDGNGWEQQNEKGEWVKWEKPKEPIYAKDEPLWDPSKIEKDAPPHNSKGQLEPKLDGNYTPEEIWKAAAAKQAYVESMIKNGKIKFKEKSIQDQIDAGVPLLDAVDSLQPGKGVKEKIQKDPTLNKRFWDGVGNKLGKAEKVVIISIIILLLLLGLWYAKKPEDKKTGDPAQGSQESDKSSGESSPAGTSIPADQVPWKWIVTGSTDPNVDLDSMANAREVYDQVKSQSVTKNQNGNWQTSNNKVLNNNNGPAASRLEALAKMTPEERKKLVDKENVISVELVANPEVSSVDKDSAKEPNDQNPEIVLAVSGKCPAGYKLSKDGKTCEKDSEVDSIPVITLPSKTKREGIHSGR